MYKLFEVEHLVSQGQIPDRVNLWFIDRDSDQVTSFEFLAFKNATIEDVLGEINRLAEIMQETVDNDDT